MSPRTWEAYVQELLYHKPIKYLPKERVPINIVDDRDQHRKELSDDRKACRIKYNRKSK